MGEGIFFIIDGKELVLDKVLVAFNEMPIFFVCKFERMYFVALCVDVVEERYLVASIKLHDLSRMLHRKITMRDFILQSSKFWDVAAGVRVSEDVIVEKNAETILLDELPHEGEYLTIATKDLIDYVEEVDSILYSGKM